MRIRACLRCGSPNLDFTPGDGMAILTRLGVGPVAGIAVCRDCGQLGAPIEFEDEKSYIAFLSHLRRIKESKMKKKKTKTRKRSYKKRE